MKAPGDLTEDELDEALDALFSRTQSQEISALQQLETINATLHKFSMQSVTQCLTSTDEMINKSDQLKDDIRSYFNGKVLFDIDPKQQVRNTIVLLLLLLILLDVDFCSSATYIFSNKLFSCIYFIHY